MGKKAVIYSRVSTSGQAEKELPIESQMHKCREKAEFLGATVVKEFVDAGISGRSTNRPEFQSAITYCELHKPDFFITWSTSRFSRNRVDAALYKRRLSSIGVSVEFASMEIDRSTMGGFMVEGVMELFDEAYSMQVSSDTLRSMIKNAEEGFWNGGHLPFGFRAVVDLDNKKRKRLEPFEEEAETLKRIFKMKTKGKGARTIALELNELGELRRGVTWKKNTIANILKNPVVIGKTRFGRRDRNGGVYRPDDECILVDSHPAVIDQKTWDAVQGMIIKETRSPAGSQKSTHLFTGLFKCGDCGSNMRIRTATGRSKTYSYYECGSRIDATGCKKPRVPSRELDNFIIDNISSDIFTESYLAGVIAAINEASDSWEESVRERKKEVSTKIKRLEAKNQNIFEAIESMGGGAGNISGLVSRLNENEAKIDVFKRDLVELSSARDPDSDEDPLTEDDAEDLYVFLNDMLKTASPKKVRDMLKTFVVDVVLKEKEIIVNYEPAMLIEPVHSNVNWLLDLGSNQGPND